MNLDIIMLGGFLSIIQEHMLLLWRMYRIHTRVIFLGTAMYNTTGLKHSETDVVEEVFVDQLGLARQNLEKLYRESILRIIWPLPGLLTILQKTFEKLTKNRTLDWLSTGFTVNSTVLTSLI
jgi:hypothetical protein